MKKALLISLVLVILLSGCYQTAQVSGQITIPSPIPTSTLIVIKNTKTPLPTAPEPESTLIPANTDLELSDPTTAQHTRSLIVSRAAKQAVESMPGPYSWDEFRTCSTFVSAYLRYLSFPIGGPNGLHPGVSDPFPWSSVMEQTDWLRRNYPQYTFDAPLIDFLDGKLWDRLQPGDVIYLQTATSHNGYNTYSHTVVYLGTENGEPIFAELAAGMKNASDHRTFAQMTENYVDPGGNWDVRTNPISPSSGLIVTWFDPLAVLNEGNLWQKPGAVVPNSKKLLRNYDQVLTINLYDGTTAIFRNSGSVDSPVWEPVLVQGRQNFYSVTGRLLPANKSIGHVFADTYDYSIYDSDFGIYISEYGVYQHTWTPQFLAKLTGFEYLDGFGDLPGGTFTSLLMPQVYKNGRIVDYWDYSPFTFHRIPDVESQDMLLRQDLLIKANDPQSPEFGPIPVPAVYLSSGCVNFDRNTWEILQGYLQSELDKGQQIAVVFSYPGFDQNLLPTTDIFKAPFTGRNFLSWCPNDENVCDPLDRRNYRETYLD